MAKARRRLAGSVLAALMLSGAAALPAQAQQQDGLINVIVGDITIAEDVNIGLGAQAAANVCGVKVGPVAVLATQVDRSGDATTVCTIDQAPVRITQS
jgi:hypothetical protein